MKKDKISLFSILKRIIPMTYKASPKWFIINCLSAVLHGISWGMLTVSMQWFIDSVLKVTNGEASYSYSFQMLVLFFCNYTISKNC